MHVAWGRPCTNARDDVHLVPRRPKGLEMTTEQIGGKRRIGSTRGSHSKSPGLGPSLQCSTTSLSSLMESSLKRCSPGPPSASPRADKRLCVSPCSERIANFSGCFCWPGGCPAKRLKRQSYLHIMTPGFVLGQPGHMTPYGMPSHETASTTCPICPCSKPWREFALSVLSKGKPTE